MPLKLNSTGGGSVTLDVPSTASNFTLTAPANTSTLFTTSGGEITGNVNLTGNLTYTGGIISPRRLSTITVSNGASISSTNVFSGFSDYEIHFENVVTATSSAGLYLRWYAGGSYQSSGYSTYMAIFNGGGSSAQLPTTYIDLAGGGRISNTAGRGWIGRILLLNASATSGYRQHLADTSGLDSTTAGYNRTWGGGELNVAAAITGFQIYASSGNITGTANIYGIT